MNKENSVYNLYFYSLPICSFFAFPNMKIRMFKTGFLNRRCCSADNREYNFYNAGI